MNWSAVTLSLQVTLVATLAISVVGLLLAFVLARVEFPGKIVLETVINLPLVLPPSVVGYYLLLLAGVADSLHLARRCNRINDCRHTTDGTGFTSRACGHRSGT